MARPTKQGIDYFSLDCQFDDKTEMYLIETGATGLAVLVTIWQMIYTNHGYYIEDSDDLYLLIKRRVDVGINEVSDCIKACLRRRIFNPEIYEKHKILTSKAIQRRFFDAAKKKKSVEVITDYLLIPVDSVINGVFSVINSVNSSGNATKEKEEVKEKEEEDIGVAPPRVIAPYSSILDLYHEHLPNNPRVVKLTDKRKGYINARWKNELPTLDDWREYFKYCGESKFLTGRKDPVNGRKRFYADIEFLSQESTVVATQEGKYHD